MIKYLISVNATKNKDNKDWDGLGSLVTRLSKVIEVYNNYLGREFTIDYYPAFTHTEIGIPDDCIFIDTIPIGIASSKARMNDVKKTKAHKIAYTMFETDSIPIEMKKELPNYDLIVVPEEYLVGTYGKNTDKPIVTFPIPNGKYNTEIDKIIEENYKRPKIEHNNWLYIASGSRKNYEDLINAFLELGTRKDKLYIHDKFGQYVDSISNHIKKRIKNDKRFVLTKGIISKKQIDDLYFNSSLYVCTSDGEGWNLPLREAMLYGIPALCPTNSVHMNHINDGAIPIECTKKPKNCGIAYAANGFHLPGSMYPIMYSDLISKLNLVKNNYNKYKELALEAAKTEYFYSYETLGESRCFIFDKEYLNFI